jgi:hypothetical protein
LFRVDAISRQDEVVCSKQCIGSQPFAFGKGFEVRLRRDNDMMQDLDVCRAVRACLPSVLKSRTSGRIVGLWTWKGRQVRRAVLAEMRWAMRQREHVNGCCGVYSILEGCVEVVARNRVGTKK